MWSQVECGYDSANETIVFGSRQIAEGDALYETSTVAVVSTEQPTKNPSVQCMNRDGKILLAIDETFRILSNGCTTLDYSYSFECSINSFNFSLDEQILIVCLNDGTVHCLHVLSNGKPLCSKLIKENINGSIFTIFPANDDDSRSFIICTGQNIYRLKINNIQEVYNKINSDDLTVDFTFDNLNINVNPSLTSFRYDSNLYYVSNMNCFTDCDELGIALDEEESIIAVCKLTKLSFKLYNKDAIKNLMVLKSTNSDDQQLLTYSTTETDCHIKLLSYPNFDTIYNLKVTENIYFVSMDNNQNDVMFIEGVRSKGSEYINELRLKVITESNPDIKLKRLLRRKCFEEAKNFARIFKLDMQQIYIAEAEEYIIKNDLLITNVEEFCKILDNITDIIFIVEQCLINTTADTLDNIERMLKYSYNRLQIILQNNPSNEIFRNYKSTILNLFFKLDTFKLLHCNEQFSNSELLIESWVHFKNVDLFAKMYNYLKNRKLNKCTLLFTRLQQQNILDSYKIKNILDQIPVEISLLDFLPLLRHILLFSLEIQPECLPIFINWVYNVVFRLNTSKSDTLEYLLNFCKHINKFLYQIETQNLAFHKNITEDDCLNKFRHLLLILNELFILKRDFGIIISITDYMQDPNTAIQILIDTISLKNLNDFMNNFVFEFCSKHRMSCDDVLSHYIKFISGTQKSYWEETVICLIPFILSNTLRIQTMLIVLESADVPWDKRIEQLAKRGSKECHPLAEKINNIKENIPWKLLLKRYSIPDWPNYDDNNVCRIIRNILKNSKSEMLEDLDIVATKYPHLKDKLQLLCFNHFVQNGKMENALKYLNNVNEKSIVKCFDSTMLFAQNFMFSNFPNNILINNYLEILSSLLLRLEKHISEYEYEVYFNAVKKLKNIYVLKQKYNCNEILNLEFNLSTLLPKLINNIITPVNDQINWIEVVNKCEQLSLLLEISKEDCFFELGKQNPNLESLIYSAKSIIKSDSSALNMCTMSVLLMKNIDNNQTYENVNQNDFNLLDIANGSFSSEYISKALRLINKLAVKACVKADIQELQTACEILNWSNGCFWIKNSNDSLAQFHISALYRPENICTLSAAAVLVIKDYFNLLLKIARDRIILPNYLKDERNDSSLFEEELLNQISLLPNKIQQLHMEGHDLTAFQILNVIKIELMSISNNTELSINALQHVNSRCIPQLLDKIFVFKKIDLQLSFFLLLSSDFDAIQWWKYAVQKYKMNMKKLHAASSVACSFIKVRGIQGDAIINVKYRCEWWQKFLRHCVTSYNAIFQPSPEEIVTLYLMTSDKFNLKILKEFCHDFGLHMQNFLPAYLHNCIYQWKPKIEGDNISEGEELFEKCNEIISLMEDKKVAVTLLRKAWNEISYYQHEVYLCILDLFSTLHEKFTNADKGVLLIFLRDYRRIKNPQQKEIDDWQTKYPFAKDIDPLSKYRLPYYLEMYQENYWEVLRPEIDLMTYEKWFNNATYLNLDRDQICMYAIKGTIASGVFNSKESTWLTHSKNDFLLAKIELCVQKIVDLKIATVVLYQSVRKVTGGADQVSIARMCWKKSVQWKKYLPRSSSETEEDIQLKCSDVKRKFLNCLTTHILYTYNLGNEKYLSLIENTALLIKELYQDESIIERTKGTVKFYPDINSAIDELASQLGIDLVPIRTSLIMEFLQKSCKIINFDDSFCNSSPRNVSSTEDDIDNICDNLKRVIYICESKNTESCHNLLCNISFAKLDETISKFATSPDLSMRVKSLQCLLIVTKNIEELTEMIDGSPSTYLEKLQILLSLETLGYSLSVYELDNCNKMDLTTKILRSISSNPIVVKNLAKLCGIYDIWDCNLWNKIVQCFIDLKMHSDLQKWLPKLYNYCYALDLNCPFVNGWICLIKNSFLEALNDEKNYSHGFLLIQTCPIITMMESCLLHIFDLYFENNLFELCAMFLPYIQRNESKNRLLQALSPKKSLQLYEQINNLSLQGLLNTDIAVSLLKSY